VHRLRPNFSPPRIWVALQYEMGMQVVLQFDGSYTVLVTVTPHKIVYKNLELLNDIDIAQCCYGIV
jgi:hypothetical protein